MSHVFAYRKPVLCCADADIIPRSLPRASATKEQIQLLQSICCSYILLGNLEHCSSDHRTTPSYFNKQTAFGCGTHLTPNGNPGVGVSTCYYDPAPVGMPPPCLTICSPRRIWAPREMCEPQSREFSEGVPWLSPEPLS